MNDFKDSVKGEIPIFFFFKSGKASDRGEIAQVAQEIQRQPWGERSVDEPAKPGISFFL